MLQNEVYLSLAPPCLWETLQWAALCHPLPWLEEMEIQYLSFAYVKVNQLNEKWQEAAGVARFSLQWFSFTGKQDKQCFLLSFNTWTWPGTYLTTVGRTDFCPLFFLVPRKTFSAQL